MSNRLSLWVLWMVVAVAVAAVAQQSISRIFLDGRLYSGPSSIDDGKLMLPLKDYVDALHLSMHQQGDCYCIFDPAVGDAKCPIKQGTPAGLFVNGQAVSSGVVDKDGVPWVTAQAVTEGMGGTYHYDVSFGVVEMVVHKRASASAPAPVAATGGFKVGPDDIDITTSVQHADVSLHMGQPQVTLCTLSCPHDIAFRADLEGEFKSDNYRIEGQGKGFCQGGPFCMGVIAPNGYEMTIVLDIVGKVTPGVHHGALVVKRQNDATGKCMRIPVNLTIQG